MLLYEYLQFVAELHMGTQTNYSVDYGIGSSKKPELLGVMHEALIHTGSMHDYVIHTRVVARSYYTLGKLALAAFSVGIHGSPNK